MKYEELAQNHYNDIENLSRLMKNARMEQKLKNAVDNLDFVLHYQPQFDAEKKIIRGVEALIRWKISENELISPGEFIPMAEKNGCIVNIGEWVVNQSLEDFCNWKDNYGYKGGNLKTKRLF